MLEELMYRLLGDSGLRVRDQRTAVRSLSTSGSDIV
jgi:hypothetical protein